jgi:hypothetical protein
MASGKKYKSSNLAVSLEEQLATAVRESNVDAVQNLLLAGEIFPPRPMSCFKNDLALHSTCRSM